MLFVIEKIPCGRPLRSGCLLPQQPDCVLAVIPSQSYELVENLDSITERRAAIPQLQCGNQLFACRHADLPRHLVRLLPGNPTGSKLREATGKRELQVLW